jgi:8-oxo-dGTP diphosphatase
MRSGNGWVTCQQGHQHWGLFGAAGLLVYAPDPEDETVTLVLMQRRAQWSHQGGTWALPGGAMDSDETPAQAALREADEECMLDPKLVVPRGLYSEVHGGWTYHTILAQAAEPFRVYADSYESDEALWLPASQVDQLDLHPGFAASWPVLREALAPLTVFVDGTGLPGVPGLADGTDTVPRLRVRLTDLTRTGLAALPDGYAAPPLERWYPDYVLLLDAGLDDTGGITEDEPAANEAGQATGAARYSWNQPLVERAAEVRTVAVADGVQAADVLANLLRITPGRHLVVSDRPGTRDRAAAAGVGPAGLDWLLGPGLDS